MMTEKTVVLHSAAKEGELVEMTPEEQAAARARQLQALAPKYGEPGWNPDARDPDTDSQPNSR
jgi:hypothetical protein